MKIRTLGVAALIGAMVFSLCACGGQDSTKNTKDTTKDTEAEVTIEASEESKETEVETTETTLGEKDTLDEVTDDAKPDSGAKPDAHFDEDGHAHGNVNVHHSHYTYTDEDGNQYEIPCKTPSYRDDGKEPRDEGNTVDGEIHTYEYKDIIEEVSNVVNIPSNDYHGKMPVLRKI